MAWSKNKSWPDFHALAAVRFATERSQSAVSFANGVLRPCGMEAGPGLDRVGRAGICEVPDPLPRVHMLLMCCDKALLLASEAAYPQT